MRESYSRSPLRPRLSLDRFFEKHWQKQPLLVRSAFADFVSPLSLDELAGLAEKPDVESRLVLERGGADPWEVRYGPFTASELRAPRPPRP